METILLSCLKYVCHVLLTNSPLEVTWTYYNHPYLKCWSHQSLWHNYTAIDGQILNTV